MLVVDPGKRLTIDQCLAHPWLNYDERKPSDSTSGLVGGIAGLEISRRGQTRERTLISSLVTAQSKVQPEVGTDQGIIAGDATSQKDVFHATVEEES
jgi:serine/threonine-protein kinase Chk2